MGKLIIEDESLRLAIKLAETIDDYYEVQYIKHFKLKDHLCKKTYQ